MRLVIRVNREGIKNEEIKVVREFMSKLSQREFIGLCEGNRIKMQRCCNENALECAFSIESD